VIANLFSIGRLLQACLFSSLLFLSFALNAQTAADMEASNRLATFNGATGILRVPSLPYDGGHIWAELLYESDEDVTLVGSGLAYGPGETASFDEESGVLKVPFIHILGWSARYGMTLQATSMEPVPRFRVTERYQHSLGFLQVPDHRVRLVATGYNGEYLGLVGYPGQQPFGFVYAVETPEETLEEILDEPLEETAGGLMGVVLLLDADGRVRGLDYNGQGIMLISDNPPQIVVDDDIHGTMARAAGVFSAVACSAMGGAQDELKSVLQELCDSRLLSTLKYFQADGLFEGMETVLQAEEVCHVSGSEGLCTEGFIDGLNTAGALFDAAAQAQPPGGGEEPTPPTNARPTLTDVGALGTIGQGETLALSFNDLMVGSNARDSDGVVEGFVVQEVSSGSLTIGGSPFNASSNKVITRQRSAVWTATSGGVGNVIALRLLAVDDQGATSAVSVPARITVASGFTEGSGTASDPWVIETPAQFNLIRYNLDAHFVLGNEIDLGGSNPDGPFYNGGAGWEPIGSPANPFTGDLDGNEAEIVNLYINRPNSDYVGLFGYIAGGASRIYDLVLPTVDVTGRDYTGGLAGYDDNGRVNARVLGSVSGRHRVGGLIGGGSPSIFNLASRATVDGEDYVGGTIGWLKDGKIESYSSSLGGATTGSNYVGAVVGYAEDSDIAHITAWGDVTGDNHVGGAVGYLLNSSLDNADSIANVTGQNNVGGLVGSSINSTVTSGEVVEGMSVTGTTNTGGIVGDNTGSISNSSSGAQVNGVTNVGGIAGKNTGTLTNNTFAGTVNGS